MKLGDRIKELREKHRVTQEELAKAVGTSPTNISRLEAGEQAPRANLLAAIADYFGISTDYLLGRGPTEKDLSPELLELFAAAQKAGYAANLKEFFDWLAEKREHLAVLDEKVRREPDEELLALVPDLTPDEIKVILSKFKGDVVQRIAKLAPEQTEAFNEEVAKVLYYLELEAKVKRSGELTEADS
jgi:transcriptional regulator with XRE-family HTH domain